MSRGTHAIIDLDALSHNWQRIRELAPKARIWAVVKANGYGHGAVAVAQHLQPQSHGFAVATLDEGLELRDAGITKPILLLEGLTSQGQSLMAAEAGFDIVVHQPEQLAWLAEVSEPLRLWLKVDTGMHRLGLDPDTLAARVAEAKALPRLEHLGLMSHFACADEDVDGHMPAQLARCLQLGQAFPELSLSLANSAAVLAHPSTHADWVRPGIMLYGASPFAQQSGAQLGLRAVMHLHAPVVALRQVEAGESVGYGASWRAPVASRIATLAVGYADGYPRSAQAGTPVWLNGQFCPLVGRVSMDLITVDVTSVPCQLGDLAQLWGDQLSVDRVAEHCGTLGYELLTRRSLRVPLHYRQRQAC